MLLSILAMTLAQAMPAARKPLPGAGSTAVCRGRDGRISIRCLPMGTVRALSLRTPAPPSDRAARARPSVDAPPVRPKSGQSSE